MDQNNPVNSTNNDISSVFVTPPATPPQVVPPPAMNPQPAVGNNSNWIKFGIIAIIVLLLLGLGGIFMLYRSNQVNSDNHPSGSVGTNIFSGIQSADEKLKAKIAVDTDNDSLPDFVETELSLNPNESEFNHCQANSCNKSEKTLATTKNTLIIIDSSGSMVQAIDGRSKMELAKEAIRNFIGTVSGQENIGIMVYGYKGSNAQSDKALSCASADLIATLGSVSAASIDNYLGQIKPVGWTPIGLAIEKAISAFNGYEGQRNQIIIVSDGNETCATDPVAKAKLAYTSSAKIQVNVIGFAVAQNEQAALSDISTSGGGNFMTANTVSELESQFEASYRNMEKFETDATCITQTSDTSYSCLRDVLDKVNNYLNPLIQQNVSDGKLYTTYTDLSSSINKIYGDKIDFLLNSVSDQIDERKSTLIGQ
jgi:Mg-chelatase subunit ChlD